MVQETQEEGETDESGGQTKRPPPDREIPKGRITFEPINPYLDEDFWTAYEKYKGSKTTDEFQANGGRTVDLVRDFQKDLIEAPQYIIRWLRDRSQQPKKPKTTDSQ